MKITDIVIKEGGAAMKSVGVQRINRDDIPATIHFVSKISGIPVEDLIPLGSVGKMPTSGDIDLAVDKSKHNPASTHARMLQQLGDDMGVLNKGTGVGSYAVPVGGDPNNGYVQLDFMYVDNPEWASFGYSSPGEKSQYKGVVRTLLLRAVASEISEPGIDYARIDPETNELIIRVGRTFDMAKGLRRIFQIRPKKKTGDGYLKTMKAVSIDEIKAANPDIGVSGDELTIDNPAKALAVMFGKKVSPKEVQSAEQVIDLVKKTFPKEKQQEIFMRTAQALSRIDVNTVPPELQEYM